MTPGWCGHWEPRLAIQWSVYTPSTPTKKSKIEKAMKQTNKQTKAEKKII